MTETTEEIDDPTALSAWLADKGNEGRVVRTRLKTSDRVIARVTDGIYRQPSSALRELISNAWDADANSVTIITDAPRFSRIYVRDDGAGMSYDTLSRLLHNIGGSAKRREEGQTLGVTAPSDPERTPKGRLLIGKIGIGLFSISQLARRFRIVTKTAGSDYRLSAEVRLRAYSEDVADDEEREADDTFINGEVLINRESTSDIQAHGTDIVLEEVKPRVRDLLRSADRWRALDEKQAAEAANDLDTVLSIRVSEPVYHAGWIADLGYGQSKADVFSRPPQLPWSDNEPSQSRMAKLMDAIEAEFTRTERPDLETALDAYLEMLWTLALSSPVEYVDRHPFDLTDDDQVRLFWLSNEARGQAVEVPFSKNETVREAIKSKAPGHPSLESGASDPAGGFSVVVDGAELKRPIRFRFIQTDKRSVDRPLLFVGKYAPNLNPVAPSRRGGLFEMEGYLFWNGRVVPKENSGVLVRIRGAGGGLFDPTFFQYQISEQTRLRQITSELFIIRGLDAALNIDRESFNFSHPHVQLVTTWLHRAIRQLTNRHKDISQKLREERRSETAAASRNALDQYALDVWREQMGSEPPPEVTVGSDASQIDESRRQGYVVLSRNQMSSLATSGITGSQRDARDAEAKAIATVLSAFGVFEGRTYDEQQRLVDAILNIFVKFRQ
jgi:hypothetical protein